MYVEKLTDNCTLHSELSDPFTLLEKDPKKFWKRVRRGAKTFGLPNLIEKTDEKEKNTTSDKLNIRDTFELQRMKQKQQNKNIRNSNQTDRNESVDENDKDKIHWFLNNDLDDLSYKKG
ncbi:MAG: hypothetical protein MHPSP_003403, partial [Paramarteilia canceri]